MTDYIPTKVNITYQRGDGGHSSRTITFTHPFAAVDITEARLYIRNRVDGTLYVQIKLSTHPTQWDLGTDYTGDVTPAPDDTGALSEADYRYEIEVKTATATITAQEGIWFSHGDIATDLALDDPPSNSYYLSSEERDALDAANSPTGANPIATMNDVAGADAILDTVDPTVNDDANDGYLVGAHWVNTVSGDAFICTDNTVGAAVWDAVNGAAGGVSDGDKGDITVSGSGTTWTIDNGVVTYAKMQDVSATSRILGRQTAGAGDVEELTAANVRSLINVEDGADVTDAANVAAAGAAMSGGAHHDGFSDFVADEHRASAVASDVNTGTATDKHITPDALAGSNLGARPSSVQMTDGSAAIAVGDGQGYMRIGPEMNGMNLISCGLATTAPSTSGVITVTIERGRQAAPGSAHTWVDMLSTALTIDANEYDSKDAATAAAIDTANDDVQTGDLIRWNIDGVGSGPTAVLIGSASFRLP